MLRNSLLTIHILGAIVWLGFGVYELFLGREIRRARGSSEELYLIRLHLKYFAPPAIAVFLVALTGVWLTITLDYGFFQTIWLGTKQGLILFVFATTPFLLPIFGNCKPSSALCLRTREVYLIPRCHCFSRLKCGCWRRGRREWSPWC